MNRLLPLPTPHDIVATLHAIRKGESAICVWSQHCGIEKRDLWWVTTISPDGERHPGIGAGFTLDEISYLGGHFQITAMRSTPASRATCLTAGSSRCMRRRCSVPFSFAAFLFS